jgi:DNA topoisomerase-1
VHAEVAGAGKRSYTLAASGSTLRFDGYLKIWPVKHEERLLPRLSKGDPLALTDASAEQHFTEPPPRYNEASLIKTLESFGIGRPSTYAPIISVIQERNYVEKQQGRFYPTEMGVLVNKVLKENFPEIVDVDFTAKMEEELDEIADGKMSWKMTLREFYEPFSKHLAEKYETVLKKDIVPEEVTDQKCEKCGKQMVVKFGRFGKFLACSGFPDCKNTKTMKEPPKSSGVKCPKCLMSDDRRSDSGELLERRVRAGRARGKLFWGCAKYPACDFAVWTDPTKEPPVYDPNAPEKPKREQKQFTHGKKKEDIETEKNG